MLGTTRSSTAFQPITRSAHELLRRHPPPARSHSVPRNMLPSPALALAIGPIEKPPRILDICISRALTNTLPGAEQMAVVVGTVCSAPRCSLCRRPGRWLWVVRRYTPSQPPFSPSKPSHHGVYPRAWKTFPAIAGRAAISWSDRTEHREYPRLRECGHLGVVSVQTLRSKEQMALESLDLAAPPPRGGLL